MKLLYKNGVDYEMAAQALDPGERAATLIGVMDLATAEFALRQERLGMRRITVINRLNDRIFNLQHPVPPDWKPFYKESEYDKKII